MAELLDFWAAISTTVNCRRIFSWRLEHRCAALAADGSRACAAVHSRNLISIQFEAIAVVAFAAAP